MQGMFFPFPVQEAEQKKSQEVDEQKKSQEVDEQKKSETHKYVHVATDHDMYNINTIFIPI